MSSFTFGPLVRDTAAALATAPEAAVDAFRVDGRQVAGLQSRVRVRSFEICPALDLLSNQTPVELELQTPSPEAAESAGPVGPRGHGAGAV